MRTKDRKKKNRQKLRDAIALNPPSKEYWTSAMTCLFAYNFVKGRRRQRHKCHQLWVPPLDHPEWGRERLVIRNWRT